nr:hypothetical protein [uncultured Rhodopila sp.]
MAETTEIVSEVIETGKRVARRETQVFPDAASVGDCVRQGDIYLMLLDRVPRGAKKLGQVPRQLAPGTTQGSRHTLDSLDGVTAYELDDATEFDGPILCLACGRTVEHPEHGNWTLQPGVFAVGYQRTQDAVDRARRVED